MSRPPPLLLALALPCAAPVADAPASGLPHFDVRRVSAAAEVVLSMQDSTVFNSGKLPPPRYQRSFALGTNPAVARFLDVQLEDVVIPEERLVALEHQP